MDVVHRTFVGKHFEPIYESPTSTKKLKSSAQVRFEAAESLGFFDADIEDGTLITEGLVGWSIIDNDDGSFFLQWTQDGKNYHKYFASDNVEFMNEVTAFESLIPGYIEFDMSQRRAHVRAVYHTRATTAKQSTNSSMLFLGAGALVILYMMS